MQKTYSNGVQGAMIVVQKQSGANSVAISQKVIDMLPQLQKSLPSDVKLGIIVNTSDNILNTCLLYTSSQGLPSFHESRPDCRPFPGSLRRTHRPLHGLHPADSSAQGLSLIHISAAVLTPAKKLLSVKGELVIGHEVRSFKIGRAHV